MHVNKVEPDRGRNDEFEDKRFPLNSNGLPLSPRVINHLSLGKEDAPIVVLKYPDCSVGANCSNHMRLSQHL